MLCQIEQPFHVPAPDQIRQDLVSGLYQIPFVVAGIDRRQLHRIHQPVQGDPDRSLVAVIDDPGEQPVIFLERDALSHDTFPVGKAAAVDGMVDGPGHGIFLETIKISRKGQPQLDPVRQDQMKRQHPVIIRKYLFHDRIMVLLPEFDRDLLQGKTLAEGSVVEVLHTVIHMNLLQAPAVIEAESSDRYDRIRQAELPEVGPAVKGMARDFCDRQIPHMGRDDSGSGRAFPSRKLHIVPAGA